MFYIPVIFKYFVNSQRKKYLTICENIGLLLYIAIQAQVGLIGNKYRHQKSENNFDRK